MIPISMFLHDTVKLTISIISLILAASILFLLKKKEFNIKAKIILIYAHLLFLAIPLMLLSYSISCNMGLLNGIIDHCATAVAKGLLYFSPAFIILVAILGYIIIPAMYIKKSNEVEERTISSFVSKHSKKLNIKSPKVYLLNISKPIAFSFSNIKSAIVLSLGLANLLSKKELESVLLHELYHIKNRASVFKFSTLLIRFSPLAMFTTFNKELNKEEIEADNFAVKVQGTSKFINSAKRKIDDYNNY